MIMHPTHRAGSSWEVFLHGIVPMTVLPGSTILAQEINRGVTIKDKALWEDYDLPLFLRWAKRVDPLVRRSSSSGERALPDGH